MANSRWLSTVEIAEHLGVKRDTIYKWIERHELPAHKVGRLWKFRKHEVDQWILSENQHRDHADDKEEKEAM